jgi:hypothetical protein
MPTASAASWACGSWVAMNHLAKQCGLIHEGESPTDSTTGMYR